MCCFSPYYLARSDEFLSKEYDVTDALDPKPITAPSGSEPGTFFNGSPSAFIYYDIPDFKLTRTLKINVPEQRCTHLQVKTGRRTFFILLIIPMTTFSVIKFKSNFLYLMWVFSGAWYRW